MKSIEQLERDLAMCKGFLGMISLITSDGLLSFKQQISKAVAYASTALEQLNRPNDEKASETVKMEKYPMQTQARICDKCFDDHHELQPCKPIIPPKSFVTQYGINHSTKTATEPSSSCETEPKEPETTLGWKPAMVLVANEQNVQVRVDGEWKDIDIESNSNCYFTKFDVYRLKPVVEVVEQEIWLNLSKSGYHTAYQTRLDADRDAEGWDKNNRLACVQVKVKFKKGQGLEKK
jgi:hypothetical protein